MKSNRAAYIQNGQIAGSTQFANTSFQSPGRTEDYDKSPHFCQGHPVYGSGKYTVPGVSKYFRDLKFKSSRNFNFV